MFYRTLLHAGDDEVQFMMRDLLSSSATGRAR